MISARSIENFTFVNTLLITSALLQGFALSNNNTFINVFVTFIIRNVTFLVSMYIALYNRAFLCNHERDKQDYSITLLVIFLCSSTTVESLTHMYLYNNYQFNDSYLYHDLMWFIPVSFLYEIVFDFFHYWAHRIEHYGVLYKYVHKLHHKYKYTMLQFTHCHHPLDLVISNSLPHIITMFLIPKMSFLTYNMILIYKVYVEISGHSGKKINASSFPQCIWLPKMFNIEITVNYHDEHHIYNTRNYTKRFSLWDKVFGTFKLQNDN